MRPNRYALRHTEVEPSHQHQGVAGAMVRRVLDEVGPARARSPRSCGSIHPPSTHSSSAARTR
ncbi:GNAT family N-acetyltransferase [Kribbella soli]|uniref:GNAT family N-acetyltransferase n=1 Tax=Kribbella soli TaxID=1124743 RepID=UPI003B50B790